MASQNSCHLNRANSDVMVKNNLITAAAYDDMISAPFLCSNGLAGRDDLQIHITGNDERIVVCAQFDNLGKGASGAAVQCLNIALGCEENKGLIL
jgi:N-acetyl-gamma-glutamyl-phosphate reductase